MFMKASECLLVENTDGVLDAFACPREKLAFLEQVSCPAWGRVGGLEGSYQEHVGQGGKRVGEIQRKG